MGYHRAGLEVVSVDIEPRNHWNPDGFVQFDALRMLADHPEFIRTFDAIHASPPCQNYIAITKGTNGWIDPDDYPALLEPTRAALEASGLPYVIECGSGPHIRPDVKLCGEMFGLGVIRHRSFEVGGWTPAQPAHKPHRGRVRGWRHGKYYDGPYLAVYGKGGGKGTVAEWQAAMGIDWTADEFELREAIPPAYTERTGRQLIEHIRAKEAAA